MIPSPDRTTTQLHWAWRSDGDGAVVEEVFELGGPASPGDQFEYEGDTWTIGRPLRELDGARR